MNVPTIHQSPPPIYVDAHGIIRVGTGRVTLAAVVEAWNDLHPASIASGFGMPLPEVLAALAYYLRHQAELRPYLDSQAAEAAKLRAEIEANQKPFPTRAELLARRDHKHAETGK